MNEIYPRASGPLTETEGIQSQPRHAFPQDEIHLADYWNLLVKRRLLIFLIFLPVFAAGTYFALSATKLYTASAMVKIEPQNPRVTGVGEIQPLELRGDYDYYQTQFALLRSRTVAARVITDLGLESNKIFTNSKVVSPNPLDHAKSWAFGFLQILSDVPSLFIPASETEESTITSTATSRDLEQTVSPDLIGRYLGFIGITPMRSTRLVSVQFTTPNPDLSQMLANTHVQTFMRMSLENRFNLTKEAREFLEQKKTELQEKLERSETALNKFRRAQGVLSVEKGENIVVDRLIDLNKQLTTARAQRIEAESLFRTVEDKNYQDLAEVMRQGLVQQLKGNVANLEAEKARLGTVFKPDHPRIQELDQQIAAGRQALNDEIAAIVRGIQSSYVAARAREGGLQAETDKQQQNALKLKEVGVDYAVLQEDVNANRSLYQGVLKRLSETNVSNDLAVSNMEIAESAAKPLYPSAPNVSFYLLASMASGLSLGVGAAFLREFFDATVSRPDDVWRATGLGTLGVVPDFKYLTETTGNAPQVRGLHFRRGRQAMLTEGPAPANELTINYRPHSLIRESYRNIRTSLLLSRAEKPPQVTLVTSPSAREGKTVTSLNLAIALAQDGHSVLLIDGDMRLGCCHERLGMGNNRGLSNILTGRLSLAEGIQQTRVSGLSLLSRGIPPPNPSELLGSRRMRELVTELRERFEFILIDSPPAIAISDAAIISVLTDGVVLVFNGETTSIPYAQKAVQRLDTVRARLLGVVLNSVNLKDPHYSYYRSYSSYYGHELPHRENGSFGSDGTDADTPVQTTDMADKLASYGSRTASASAKDVMSDNSETVENDRVNGTKNPAGVKNTAEIDDALALAQKGNRPVETAQVAALEESTQPAAISADGLNRLIEALTKAIGVVAPQIIREQIAALGESRYAFPEGRIDQLLKLIQHEITDDEWKSFSSYYNRKK